MHLCNFCFSLTDLSFFAASNMALLAEEVCGSRVQHLSGGIIGDNTTPILKHLTKGQPILIPYPNLHMPFEWCEKQFTPFSDIYLIS